MSKIVSIRFNDKEYQRLGKPSGRAIKEKLFDFHSKSSERPLTPSRIKVTEMYFDKL